MATPLLDLEGTWEEIMTRLPDFSGQRLRIVVLPAEENAPGALDTRSIQDVLATIAADMPPEALTNLPPDFTDQLDHYIYGSPRR